MIKKITLFLWNYTKPARDLSQAGLLDSIHIGGNQLQDLLKGDNTSANQHLQVRTVNCDELLIGNILSCGDIA